ncbi:MAG: hypothetical protein FWE74_05705 [Oscillospiraceae bacterium]|nr:hypothetical protein [Oscillospiraceae bacterium]
MNNDLKKKSAFWLHPHVKNKIMELYKKDNCSSQSEFVEKAVLFYSGFIHTQNAGDFLPKTLASMLTGIVQTTENRISRVTFKLALEICMMMHIIAELNELPENYLTKLRGKCVKEVKKSIGAVNFESVVKSHDEFNCEEVGN